MDDIIRNPQLLDLMVNEFQPKTLVKGQQYVDQNRVLNYAVHRDDADEPWLVLVAQVQGTARRPHHVEIAWDEANRFFETTCSCPVGWECKHCAAALLELQQVYALKKTETIPLNPFAQPPHEQLSAWLDQLNQTREPPHDEPERLVYCLDLMNQHHQQTLVVQIGISRPLKQGGLSKPRPFSLNSPKTRDKLTPKDFGLISQLSVLPENKGYYREKNRYLVSSQHGTPLLYEIMETGRCYWHTVSSSPLQQGEPHSADIQWKMARDGTQSMIFVSSTQPQLIFLPISPIHYINPDQHTLGVVKTGLPELIAYQFMKLPPIPPTEVLRFSQAMDEHLKEIPALPLPQRFEHFEEQRLTPTPQLRIYKASLPFESRKDEKTTVIQPHSCLLAQCNMIYGEMQTTLRNSSPHLQYAKGNKIIRYYRDEAMENQFLHELERQQLKKISDPIPTRGYRSDNQHDRHTFFIAEANDLKAILHFKNTLAPVLQKSGWLIDSEEAALNPNVIAVDDWYSQLDETSEYDWFSLQLGVMIDGKPVNVLPMLVRAIKKNDDHALPENLILTLPGGKQLALPKERLEAITDILYQLCDPLRDTVKDALKISRSQAGLLTEIRSAFQATQLRWLGNNELLLLSEKLRGAKGIARAKPPKTFKANLRDYQQAGVNWLAFLREHRLNGLLADEMGLGKTLQTLALLCIEKQQRRLKAPCLVLAPTSVVPNWQREAETFAPHLRVLVLQGQDRKTHYDKIAHYDLVLTSYALVIRDKDLLLQHHYYYLILDEAHYIKNKQAKVTQAVQQLTADHRLCLTGTPVENHLSELWSQFNFLMPGLLRDHRSFKERFQTPIEKHHHEPTQQLLNRLTQPFLLRRTKQAVLDDLPEKTEITKTIELSPAQRNLYDSVRLAMHKKIKAAIANQGMERSQIIILDALLKLRQICCHPQLLTLPAAKNIEESTKLETLLDLLKTMLRSGRRILIFSQFTRMLTLLEAQLNAKKQAYVKLIGSTRDRKKPIQQFQDGEVPLFLISLKAGGIGLNLTAADTVIHYDPWWNPAVENQATDRAHRLGQQNPVFVYKLISANTVEEKILKMQEKKKAIADGLFDNRERQQNTLSQRDIEALFG